MKDTATLSGTTFKTHKTAHDKKKIKKDHKPWFDSDCSGKRKQYFKCKNNYRRGRTNENKDIMSSTGRSINKAFKKIPKWFDRENKRIKVNKPESLLRHNKRQERQEKHPPNPHGYVQKTFWKNK